MKKLKNLEEIKTLALDVSCELEWINGIQTTTVSDDNDLVPLAQFGIIGEEQLLVTFFNNKFFIHNKEYKFSYQYKTFNEPSEIVECIIEDLKFIRFMNQ